MNLNNLFQNWEKQLSILDGDDLLRRLPEIESVATGKIKMNGREIIQLASNNYLGLNIETTVVAAGQRALSEYGTGASGSRLLSGNLNLYQKLKYQLCQLEYQDSHSSAYFE